MAALLSWPALAGDGAVARYDDTIVSAEITGDCHIGISGHMSDRKIHAAGKAAFQVLRDNLNRTDGASVAQNGRLADFLLKKRAEIDMREGKRLVAEKGCRFLTPHAREVMESYR